MGRRLPKPPRRQPSARPPAPHAPNRTPIASPITSTAVAPSPVSFPTSPPGRALLIGIEYTAYAQQRRMDRLPGCHNDIYAMYNMLVAQYGYHPEHITILMDDSLSRTQPTRQNIVNALNTLVSQQENTSKICVVYSGHGSYQTDTNQDEADRRDETIVPCDVYEAGMMTDDFLKSQFWSRLTVDIPVTCIFDSCHSGTILDLPYTVTPTTTTLALPLPSTPIVPTIISVSGCLDAQVSNSVYNLAKSQSWQGLLSFCLRTILAQNNYTPTISTLLTQIRAEITKRGFNQLCQMQSSQNIPTSNIFRL